MKKKGFGKDRWNGYGGKIKDGESIENAAIRELREESSIEVTTRELTKVALIEFFFNNTPGWNQRAHVFFVRDWNGEPQESEEMSPKWFEIGMIPYKDMWPEDKEWLPRILAGEKLKGAVYFKDNLGNAESMDFQPLGD